MSVAAAVAAVVLCLVVAVRAPRAAYEVAAGVAAVALVIGAGASTVDDAWATARDLLPVVGYLVVILLLGRACADAGVFVWTGRVIATVARDRPGRLLALGVLAAAGVTATLTLDATVVLLAPVLVAAAAAAHVATRPVAYASVRLANSASLLLPVSNLTNLLAFEASGLSAARFAVAMAPVWVVAVLAEYAVLRTWFARDLDRPAETTAPVRPLVEPDRAARRVAVAVVLVALGAVLVGEAVGLAPVWPVLVAGVGLGAYLVHRGRSRPRTLVGASGLPLAVLVLGWGVAVDAAARAGLADLVATVTPDGTGAWSLVGLALVATALSALVNNLPATLLLVGVVAPLGPVALLAVLVGVGAGANLGYSSSLANLLWSRGGHVAPDDHPARTFHLIGVATTPAVVVVCTLVLAWWAPYAGIAP